MSNCNLCQHPQEQHAERTVYAGEPREPLLLRTCQKKGCICTFATAVSWLEGKREARNHARTAEEPAAK